ncbi:hypothetical protein HY626_01855, partial [Candidatus Uhrbacteria bacterium]|nr:hypothetical protein [Candidatus Uhrbacteria bacterium]
SQIGAVNASLILSAAGTAADAMQITTTAGGLDISVTGDAAGEDLDITTVGAATEMRLISASNQADALRLQTSDAAGGMDVDFGTGNFTLTGNGVSADLIADADLFSIDGTGTSNVTVTSNLSAEDFTIALAGATNSSLILSSTGTDADALQITASAGGIDISASAAAAGEDIDISATGSSINLTSTENDAGAIYIRENAGTSGRVRIHADQGTASDSVRLDSDVGGIHIQSGLGTADAINIDASGGAGGIDIDFGTSNMVITGTGASADFTLDADLGSIDFTGTSNVTLTSNLAAEDFTVALAGSTNSSLILSSAGTAADAMQITTTAGGLDISVTGDAAGEDLDITTVGAATEMRLTSASTATDSIAIQATTTTAGIDIDSGTGGIDILSGGVFSIDGVSASNLSVTSNLDSEDLTISQIGAVNASLILSAAGTAVDAISITATDSGNSGTANLVLGAGDTRPNASENGNDIALEAEDSVRLFATGAVVSNGAAATSSAIRLIASDAAGGMDLDFGTGNFTLTGTGVSADLVIDGDLFSIDGTGTSNVTVTSNLAAEDFTIALAGSTNSSLILSSTGTGADALQVTASAGGMDIAATVDADVEDIDITTTGSLGDINLSSVDDLSIAAASDGSDVVITAGDTLPASLINGNDFEVRAEGDLFMIKGSTAGNAVLDLLTLVHEDTDSAGSNSIGVGIAFQADDAGGIEEQASEDVVVSDVTNGGEESRFVWSVQSAGAITEGARLQGSTSGTATLDVSGWIEANIAEDNERLCHSGTDTPSQSNVVFHDCTVAGEDFAEFAVVSDTKAEPGDVVYVVGAYPQDTTKTLTALAGSQQAAQVSGVISTNPFVDVLGQSQYKYTIGAKPIALAGRAPVKVSLENGSISVGDRLVPSSIAGVVMKGTTSGYAVGIAQEAYDGSVRVSASVLDQERIYNLPKNLDGKTAYSSDPSKWSSNVGKIMMLMNLGYYSAGGVSIDDTSTNSVSVYDGSFSGSITVAEHLYGSQDMAGRIRMASGETQVRVTFETPYDHTPIVTFSARSNSIDAREAWVSNEDETGFTLNRPESTSDSQVEFNWIAVGVEDAQVTVSDLQGGWVNISVNDTNGPSAPAPVVAEEEPAVEETSVVEEAPAEVPSEEPVL